MKLHQVTVPLLALTLISISYLATLQAFSYYAEPAKVVEENPSITLILPDQEYTISTRDLETGDRELVIPTLDEAVTEIAYNENRGEIESVVSPRDYIVEVEHLRADVSRRSGETEMSFTPTYTLKDRAHDSLREYNLRLNQIYRNPLNISLKDGGDVTPLALDSAFLRAIVRPYSMDLSRPPEIDQVKLVKYITQRLTPKQKEYFNPTVAYRNTKNALNARFLGEATPVVLGVDDGPSSSGELAGRYLEVDLSQQKMYFFINHALYKEYRVSTGAEYPTPVGEYHILNKEPKAFSGIYQVWMPYWMGFKYAGDVGAYLGIHEIAYAVDENGKPLYRYGNYIGDKMTGGCVALATGEAREVYNLSTVGMLVRIVP